MESSIVIKVKYEETLRRFNARVVNEKLDLNMDALRAKIFQLFTFAPDAELSLTYVDEDGDVVALVDDEDLQDVVKQYLNPLRIAVSLIAAEKSGRSSARASGNSTPLRSPRVQPPSLDLNTMIKLYTDLTSKTSAPPTLNELFDGISKMAVSYYQNQASGSQPVKETSSHSGASNGNTTKADGGNSNGASKKQAPIGSQLVKETGSRGAASNGNTTSTDGATLNVTSGEPSPKKTAPRPALNDGSLKATVLKSKSLNEAGDTPVNLKSKSKALEADWTGTPSSSVGPKNPGGKTHAFTYSSPPPIPPKMPSDGQPSNGHPVAQPVDVGGSNLKQNADPSGSSAKTPYDALRARAMRLVPLPANQYPVSGLPKLNNPLRLVPLASNECPFSGVQMINDPAPPQNFPFEVPLKRSHNHNDVTGTIFHRGVRCDGCGVHPITGPRFISKVKENYDLCSICFADMGNDADYIRMDRPLTYRHPLSFKGLNDLHGRSRIPTVPQVSRGCGLKSGRPKLDSRFILDVNVLDGTLMAPLTGFTKIWRMRNNGNLIWPQGTQLVWIGGDKLSHQFSVALEITSAGLAVDQELDVAVDFTAPEQPGRYISYWRMASPSGQKFGQRVWVLIQVDASFNLPKNELVHEAFQGLNLNYPPVSNGELNLNRELPNAVPEPKSSDIVNLNIELQNAVPEPKSSNTTTELVDSVADVTQRKDQESKFPINDSLLVGVGDKSSSSLPGSSISYPIIDLSEEVPAVTSMAPSAPIDVQAPLQDVGGNNDVEVSLLRELEEMGFRQIDLNKEILRKNEYDLEQSVDDLCGVSEWDPILEELAEMGFSDKEMNKKLLKKNNGSIKRVVMDLIAGEK